MKIYKYIAAMILGLAGCFDLDLNPLSQSSSGNFYSNQKELEMAISELYRSGFYSNDHDRYTDSFWERGSLGNSITFGTINADDAQVLEYWNGAYRIIARVNSYLANMSKAANNTPGQVYDRLQAEARFFRAYQYSNLVTHFGDVPFLTELISLSDAYTLPRTDKNKILEFVFSELDWAAQNLPKTYGSGELRKVTRGTALLIKARTALYTGNWAIARSASEEIMKLAGEGVYQLHPYYEDLFKKSGQTSKEIIFSIPMSQALGAVTSSDPLTVQQNFNRLNGGTAALIPTWEIVDSYECTDGLPIDKSPLYDYRNPFKNRDPRMTMSIVEFGTPWLGFTYQPHPDSLLVLNYKTGTLVSNLDTRSVQPFASWTGFLWRKGIEQDWVDRRIADTDVILARYAEALLIYAESKIELGEADASVLNAINQVRARAYGVNVSDTSRYPAVKTNDANELRTLIKRERRVEFTKEGLRYMDLIRWRIAGKALGQPVLGFPDPVNQDRTKWPFSGVPTIDEDGIPDYTSLKNNVKVLAARSFDEKRQYLWPIPSIEMRINSALKQNDGY